MLLVRVGDLWGKDSRTCRGRKRSAIKILPSDHVIRAGPKQLGDAGVQFIPVAFHEPVCVVLDGVIVVMDCELLQPGVCFQVLLVGDLRNECNTSSEPPEYCSKVGAAAA